MSAQSSYRRAGQARPADTPGAAEPAGPGARQRRPAAKGLRLAQAACGAGLAYAAVSVYWALGGTWLLDTVGGTLEQQGRTGNPGIILAVCAAAALKVIGAIAPLAAVGVTSGQATIAGRRQVRVLAWLQAIDPDDLWPGADRRGVAGAVGSDRAGGQCRSPGACLARLPLGSLVPALGSACRRCPGEVPATRRRPDRARPLTRPAARSAAITRLCRCARGVPVLSAFAADTGVQVGQPGVGHEANALGEKPPNGQMTRRISG